MKKTLISVTLILSQIPFAVAQEAVSILPPVTSVTQRLGVAGEMESLNRRMINRDRINRDEEIVIRQLIDENSLLTQALCERQHTVLKLRKEIYGIEADSGLANACDSNSWLLKVNRAMTSYRDGIVQRDRTLIANESNSATAWGYNQYSQEVIDLAKEVEMLKATRGQYVPSMPREVQAGAVVVMAPREVEAGPVVVSASTGMSDVLKELRAKLSLLEEKYAALSNKEFDLGSLKQEIINVNAQLRRVHDSYGQLIDDLSKRHKETLVALNTKTTEHQQMLASLNAKTAELDALRKQWEGKDRILLEMKDKLTASDAKLFSINGVIESKDKEILDLRAQLAAVKKELLAVKVELTSTKDQLSQVKVDLTNTKNELAVLKARSTETSRIIDLQKKVIREAKLNYDSLKISIDETSGKLSIKEEAFKRLSESMIALKIMVENQRSDILAKDKEIARLAQELDKTRAHSESLDLSVEESAAMMSSLRDQVQVLKSEFASRSQGLSQVEILVSELREQIQSLQEQLAKANYTIKEKNEIIASKESDLKRRDNIIKEKDALIASIEMKLKNLDDVVRQKNLLIAGQEADINKRNALIKENDAAINNKNVSMNETAAALKLKEDELSRILNDLRLKDEKIAQLNEGLKQFVSFSADYKDLINRTQDLSVKLANLIKRSQEQEAKALQARNEKALLEERLRASEQIVLTQRQDIETLRSQSVYANAKYIELSNQTAAMEGKVSDIIETRRQEGLLQSEQFQQLRLALANKQAEADALRNELRVKQEEAAQVKAMLDVYQQRNEEFNGKYEGKLQEMIAARKRQAELEEQIARLSDVIAQKDEQIKKGQEYFSELERRFADKDQEIKAKDLSMSMIQKMLDQKTADEKSKLEQWAQDQRLKEEQVADLRKQLSMALENVKIAQEQAKKSEASLLQAQNEAQSDEESAGAQLAEIVRLKNDLSIALQKVKSAQDQARAKEEQLKASEVLLVQERNKAQEGKKLADAQLAEISKLKNDLNLAQENVKKAQEQLRITEEQLKATQELVDLVQQKAQSDKELTGAQLAEMLKLKNDLSLAQENVKKAQEQLKASEDLLAQERNKAQADKRLADAQLAEISRLNNELSLALQNLKKAQEQLRVNEEKLKASEALLAQAYLKAKSDKELTAAQLAEMLKLKNDLNLALDQVKKATLDLEYKDKEVLRLKLLAKEKEAQLLEEIANIQKRIKLIEPRIIAKDAQIQKMKEDFASKGDSYKIDLEKLKNQISLQKGEIIDLKQRLQHSLAGNDNKNKEKIKLQQDAVAALEAELSIKSKALLSQRQQVELLQRQLNEAYQQVNELKEKLKGYELLIRLGGNKGYLLRDGKATQGMMEAVNIKIDSLQAELAHEKSSYEELESKYQALINELKEVRGELQTCIGKVMLNQKSQTPKQDLY